MQRTGSRERIGGAPRSPKGGSSRKSHFPMLWELQPKAGEVRPQKGVKYSYDVQKDSWSQEQCVVNIEVQPFAEGGMRWCLKMHLMTTEGKTFQLVGKVFKKDLIDSAMEDTAYFNEAITQTVCAGFAQEFNKCNVIEKGKPVNIQFLPVSVVQLTECGGKLIHVEPLLEGRYVKHNDNDGHVQSKELIPQTFSHFTWEISDHKTLVCDIQGVGNFYTDPQIHSVDGGSFGVGNTGIEGIRSFLQSHKCNAICRQLNLPQYKTTDDSAAAGVSRTKSSDYRTHLLTSAIQGGEKALQSGLQRATKMRQDLKNQKQGSDEEDVESRIEQLKLLKAQQELKLQLMKQTENLANKARSDAQRTSSDFSVRTDSVPMSPTGSIGDKQSQGSSRTSSVQQGSSRTSSAQQGPTPAELKRKESQKELMRLLSKGDIPSEDQLINITRVSSSISDSETLGRPIGRTTSSTSSSSAGAARPSSAGNSAAIISYRRTLEMPETQSSLSCERTSSTHECRFCSVAGTAEQVSAHGDHHLEGCPRRPVTGGSQAATDQMALLQQKLQSLQSKLLNEMQHSN